MYTGMHWYYIYLYIHTHTGIQKYRYIQAHVWYLCQRAINWGYASTLFITIKSLLRIKTFLDPLRLCPNVLTLHNTLHNSIILISFYG